MENILTKTGYMVHLSNERDDSIDLDFKRRVLEVLLMNTFGILPTNFLSYKNNPLVAQVFIKQLKDDGIDTIVVHDPVIFNKEVIKLFIEANFHFLLVEINGIKSKFGITSISNSDLKNTQFKKKIGASNWRPLASKYKKKLIHNEKTAKWLNRMMDEREKKTI